MNDLEQDALFFLRAEETAREYLTRIEGEKFAVGVAFIDRGALLRSSTVLEIGGLASTGKTELLYSVRNPYISLLSRPSQQPTLPTPL